MKNPPEMRMLSQRRGGCVIYNMPGRR